MSIERHSSDRDSDALVQRSLENRRADTKLQGQQRETPSAEAVDRFRNALQKQAEPGQQSAARRASGQPGQQQVKAGDQGSKPAQAAQQPGRGEQEALQQSAAGNARERAGRKEDSGQQAPSSRTEVSGVDMASMWQAQMALRSEAPALPPTPPTPVNTQAFADLIQRHVRQMAASDSALRDSDGQVLLRMSDATLPGTDLLLSRTADGWRLRADSRSRSSYDAIREAAPELARRFADSNLGHLEIDPQFHG